MAKRTVVFDYSFRPNSDNTISIYRKNDRSRLRGTVRRASDSCCWIIEVNGTFAKPGCTDARLSLSDAINFAASKLQQIDA